MTYIAIDSFLQPDESETTRVVVATTNLLTGAVLTTNNLASKRFPDSDLKTDDWVSPIDADILLGHRILKPINRSQVVEWHNTDIVITNHGSPQPSSGAYSSKAANGLTGNAQE